MDEDGNNYLIFGTFNYYMARLNTDMISLAEKPRGVRVNREQHRDDKPFLHRRGAVYYLSWGCFYAMGATPYGPFNYSGRSAPRTLPAALSSGMACVAGRRCWGVLGRAGAGACWGVLGRADAYTWAGAAPPAYRPARGRHTASHAVPPHGRRAALGLAAPSVESKASC